MRLDKLLQRLGIKPRQRPNQPINQLDTAGQAAMQPRQERKPPEDVIVKEFPGGFKSGDRIKMRAGAGVIMNLGEPDDKTPEEWLPGVVIDERLSGGKERSFPGTVHVKLDREEGITHYVDPRDLEKVKQ